MACISLFWGVPMVCLELIGIARHSWVTVLVLVIPATMIGVFAGAVLEHLFVVWLGRRESPQ